MMRATLLHDGDVYAPEPRGRASVLALGTTIANVGRMDPPAVERALAALGIELELLSARGCVIAPGLIDPHEHLLGSSGENGFSTRAPELFCVELITAAITTVVGTIGTDNTMRTMSELLAKVKAFDEEGLTAYMYSGGYTLPPMTLMGSLRNDLMFIERVIGAGEIAISDRRAVQPSPRELASVVTETYVGGMLSRKAGVTHLHVGDGPARLAPVRAALEEFDLDPASLYPTHISRNRELLREAAELSNRGMFVDMDTTDHNLPKCLEAYAGDGGDLAKLTISTDAGSSTPGALLAQIAAGVRAGWPLERLLPLATTNTACVLKLAAKGRLEKGCDADLVALRAGSLEPVHVVARGRTLMRDGEVVSAPAFLQDSDRQVTLSGEKR